jgi:hypothetical protein
MESRRVTNPALPRGLYLAQLLLYSWAIYAIVWSAIWAWAGEDRGAVLGLAVVFGFARALAAYGVSNEGKWGYWLGLIVCGVTVVPTLDDLVHQPSLLLHVDFLVLIALPIAVFFYLLDPSSRDYARTWFR